MITPELAAGKAGGGEDGDDGAGGGGGGGGKLDTGTVAVVGVVDAPPEVAGSANGLAIGLGRLRPGLGVGVVAVVAPGVARIDGGTEIFGTVRVVASTGPGDAWEGIEICTEVFGTVTVVGCIAVEDVGTALPLGWAPGMDVTPPAAVVGVEEGDAALMTAPGALRTAGGTEILGSVSDAVTAGALLEELELLEALLGIAGGRASEMAEEGCVATGGGGGGGGGVAVGLVTAPGVARTEAGTAALVTVTVVAAGFTVTGAAATAGAGAAAAGTETFGTVTVETAGLRTAGAATATGFAATWAMGLGARATAAK